MKHVAQKETPQEETVAIEIGLPVGEDTGKTEQQKSDHSKSLRDRLAYFNGKIKDHHGIKLNRSGNGGSRSVWLNPYNLLRENDPMETEEISRAVQSLGFESIDKMKVGSIECKTLDFKQSFFPPQKLDAESIENIAVLSGLLVELEETGLTDEFKEFLSQGKSKTVSDILDRYTEFEKIQVQDLENQEQESPDLEQDVEPEENGNITMTMTMG